MTDAALVFIGAFILDFVWARYNIATAHMHVWQSGIFAGLIYLFNSSIVIGIVAHNWLLLPAAIGAVAGTVASVRLKKGAW